MNGAIIKHMQTDMTHDLECINQYTRRPFTEQEVYTFSVVLCDNEIDRDFERFSVEALHTLSQLFLGKRLKRGYSFPKKKSEKCSDIWNKWKNMQRAEKHTGKK